MAGRTLPPEDIENIPTVELLNELKRRHAVLSRPPIRAAIVGPPCIGKRTQADAFRRAFGVCHVRAADIFRESGQASSDSGSADDRALTALSRFIDRPQCRRGFILEGFPSTAAQADGMQTKLQEMGVPLEHAFFLEASQDALQDRCRGRSMHERSGRRYHDEFKPPMDSNVDDYTGDPLVRKPFDEEQFTKDYGKHCESVEHLKEFFKRAGIARDIDAAGTMGSVMDSILDAAGKKE